MINITIDGQSLEVAEGVTVLQAARQAGIEIPTLCDHPNLTPYGGCRLCVVEIEGARGLQASCTLPVYQNMVVRTDTPKLRKAREFVLTLLFSERNHFCPFCQKTGGDCELQNSAYGEDMTHWPLVPTWKVFPVDASHPYFVVDNSRCILCRRCVRACGELVGNFTWGIENRGYSSMLVADYGVPAGESSCIRCGTCVQVCPTGALIDRQSAYLGVEKKMVTTQSICLGCSVGCGINLVVRNNQVVRVEGDWQADLNSGVLCETGRYQGLNDERQRISQPMVRVNDKLQPATWDEAVENLAGKLAPLAGHNGGGVAALASTRLSTEALYTFKQIFQGRLAASVVTSLEEDLTHQPGASAGLRGTLSDLKASDCVVVVGADLVKGHMVAGFFVKRNLPKGTRLIVIDPYKNEMAPSASLCLHPKPGSDVSLLNGVMVALANLGQDKTQNFDPESFDLAQLSEQTGIPVESIGAVARELSASRRPVIVYGKGVTGQRESKLYPVIEQLALMTGAKLINPGGKANSLAAQMLGLDSAITPQHQEAAFVALGDDFPTPRLTQHLQNVPYLAVQAAYSSSLTERADVVLPVGTWPEEEGHFVNLDGQVQLAHQAVKAPDGVLTNDAALHALAERLGVPAGDGWQAVLDLATA